MGSESYTNAKRVILVLLKMKSPYQITKVVNTCLFKLVVHLSYTLDVPK